MRYKKTKKEKSTSPERPSKFTDEEVDKNEEVKKLRKIKTKRLRDPIKITQEIAGQYQMPTMLYDINLDNPNQFS